MKKYLLKKETLDTLKFIGLLIITFIVITVVITYIPPFNQYNVFAVQTDSMDPVIEPGDIVLTRQINPENIEVGDIMAFNVDITGDGVDDVVVHYINEINSFNGELIFKTKPHVSELQDRWTIEEADLIGVYQYQINGLGKILLFAQSWVGRLIILLDIIIISVLYDILFSKKKPTDDPEKDEVLDEKQDNEKASTS